MITCVTGKRLRLREVEMLCYSQCSSEGLGGNSGPSPKWAILACRAPPSGALLAGRS